MVGDQCGHPVWPPAGLQFDGAVESVEPGPPALWRVADVVQPCRADQHLSIGQRQDVADALGRFGYPASVGPSVTEALEELSCELVGFRGPKRRAAWHSSTVDALRADVSLACSIKC